MGDKYLRRLLIVGMTSLIRRTKYKPDAVDARLAHLLSRKPVRVVTVALANKTARVIWAIMTRGGTYRAPQPVGASVLRRHSPDRENQANAEQIQRLRGRCDVMANRSDRG